MRTVCVSTTVSKPVCLNPFGPEISNPSAVIRWWWRIISSASCAMPTTWGGGTRRISSRCWAACWYPGSARRKCGSTSRSAGRRARATPPSIASSPSCAADSDSARKKTRHWSNGSRHRRRHQFHASLRAVGFVDSRSAFVWPVPVACNELAHDLRGHINPLIGHYSSAATSFCRCRRKPVPPEMLAPQPGWAKGGLALEESGGAIQSRSKADQQLLGLRFFQNVMVSEGAGRLQKTLLNRRLRRDLRCSLLEGACRGRMGRGWRGPPWRVRRAS